jgi:hypothetical protein
VFRCLKTLASGASEESAVKEGAVKNGPLCVAACCRVGNRFGPLDDGRILWISTGFTRRE